MTLIDTWQRAGERLNCKHINQSKRPRLMEKLKILAGAGHKDVWILAGKPKGNHNDTVTLQLAVRTYDKLYIIEDSPAMYGESELINIIRIPLDSTAHLLHAMGIDEVVDADIKVKHLEVENICLQKTIEQLKQQLAAAPRPVGRPKKYTNDEQLERIRAAAAAGESLRSIAIREGMSPSTVSKIVK